VQCVYGGKHYSNQSKKSMLPVILYNKNIIIQNHINQNNQNPKNLYTFSIGRYFSSKV
jgi:hypothetical protein